MILRRKSYIYFLSVSSIENILSRERKLINFCWCPIPPF